MNAIEPVQPPFDDVYQRIKAILTEARNRAWQAVNAAMVAAYWDVGRIIVEVEQGGQDLSSCLKSNFGKGFDPSNLSMMRAFFLATRFLTHCVENGRGLTAGFCSR